MDFTKFIIAFSLTAVLIYILNQKMEVGGTSIPPIGKLMNPFTGFWQNAIPSNDYDYLEIDFSDLSSKASVIYDDRLVPHIFAENKKDAAFLQGYITAQHRLWQMDIATRAVSGRLSEILGEQAVERDKLQRRKGLVYAAKNALKGWQKADAEFELLEYYTRGVNHYISSLKPKDYPLEFKLMDYSPEPWSNLKSAFFIKSMAESLCFRNSDIPATNSLSIWGKETYDFLFPAYNPKQSPIIPKNIEWKFTPTKIDSLKQNNPTMIGQFQHRSLPMPPEIIGSNNWAVSGSKTASGNPILCNDPHLGLTLPAIWFELQIHTPNSNCYGVSLPGVPGIIIGFNNDIAWGVTNVAHDVLDWYTIDWTDEKKDTYYLDGAPKKVSTVVEHIAVLGQETVHDTVKYTYWGPIVYEEANTPYQDLAMRWVVHDVPHQNELNVFLKLNAAKNYSDYSEALNNYNTPAQNFAFASKEGDIALKVQGKFPLKKQGQGRFIQEGNSSSNAWQGFIPKDQIPQVKNPERGFVSSANQRSTAKGYPYYYNGYFSNYRGRYINRKLAAMDSITIEDMMKMQNNNYSVKAEETLPLFLKELNTQNLTKLEKDYLKLLMEWDYDYGGDQIAPILFDKWFSLFYRNTWDEVYAANDSLETLFPQHWRTISLLENSPTHPFFDKATTTTKETATDIVSISFKRMCQAINTWQENNDDFTWQNYKSTDINHLARIAPFTNKDVQIGGTVNAINANNSVYGASWRMIVELGKQPKAFGVYPGGQSGNPGSPFYQNMVESWAKGKYFPLNFMQDKTDLNFKVLHSQNNQ